jgi:TDG/mug DNA glycosylase family protein
MGFSRDELAACAGRSVPDLVPDDPAALSLLFVGINPGLWTAAAQAHFAHPGNRFFKALHTAGITPEVLDVSGGFDERSRSALVGRGIGITNLVERATARADELGADELRAGAVCLETKVRAWKPRVVAVVGLGAYRTAFRQPRAAIGRQEGRWAGTEIWALPNPSGLNAHYQTGELAALYRRAAKAAGVPLARGKRVL